jgi:hypothetical protein
VCPLLISTKKKMELWETERTSEWCCRCTRWDGNQRKVESRTCDRSLTQETIRKLETWR